MVAHLTLIALAAATLAAPAAPSPATGPCLGPPPALGARVHGPVLHVLDGATLCVARGASPETWAPLELEAVPFRSDRVLDAAARGTLMAAAFARNASCRVVAVRGGRSIADCRVQGRRLSRRIREPDAILAGALWREARTRER